MAAWHYLYRWFAPLNLVADNPAFPVYRSVLEPAVLLACGALVLLLALLLFLWRSHAPLVFLVFSAYALISPTSSIVPLSEMVNEHRPYLLVALLSLSWLLPLGRFLSARLREKKGLFAAGTLEVVTVLASFSLLT